MSIFSSINNVIVICSHVLEMPLPQNVSAPYRCLFTYSNRWDFPLMATSTISFPFPIACRLTAWLPFTLSLSLPPFLCLPVSIPVLFNLPPDTSLTATGHEQNFCSIYNFFPHFSFFFFSVSPYSEYEQSQVAKMLKQNEKSRPESESELKLELEAEPVNVMTGSVTSGPGQTEYWIAD